MFYRGFNFLCWVLGVTLASLFMIVTALVVFPWIGATLFVIYVFARAALS